LILNVLDFSTQNLIVLYLIPHALNDFDIEADIAKH